MRTIDIGIVGGCMTCQGDLKLSQLFHRILTRKLLDQDGIKSFVNLRYYNDYIRIPELGRWMVENKKADILILQVRPAPFIMRSEFLIQDFKGHFIINPLILSEKRAAKIEDILGTIDPVIFQPGDIQLRKDRHLLQPILDRNIEIGKLLGLQQRAVRAASYYILQLSALCLENDIPLVVIGVINSVNKRNGKLLSIMNEKLKSMTLQKGITYIDLHSTFGEDPESFFGDDPTHLNARAHDITASLLYEQVKMVLTAPEVRINS